MAVFLPAIGYDFISHDDAGYVSNNAAIAGGLSADSIRAAFTDTFVGSWFPLSILSHALDVHLFDLNAAGHHAVSVLLHVVNVLLLFHVLNRMTDRRWPSAVVALLFAVHPLHVEPVVWISSRKDVLSTFFLLAAVWAHATFARTGGKTPYIAAVAAFTAGMLSKSTIVTLPFALMLLDFWPLRRIASRRDFWACLREKIPMLAVGFAVVAISAAMIADELGSAAYRPLEMRLTNAVVACAVYLWMTAVPTALAPYYSYPYDWGFAQFAVALAVLSAISLAAILQIRKRPYLFTGFFWFAGTLVPVLGIVQYSDHLLADHYTYVPHIGLFIALVWLVAEGLTQTRSQAVRVCTAVTSVAIVSVWAVVATLQVQHWATPSTLYERTVQNGLPNPVAYMLLGSAYLREGNDYAAIPLYEAAIELEPDLVPALNDLGMLYGMNNRLAEAEIALARASSLDPEHAAARNNLRITRESIELHRRRDAELREKFEAGMATPQDLLERARILANAGEYAAAAEFIERVADENPALQFEAAYYLELAGLPEQAIPYYESVLSHDPQNPVVRYRLAQACFQSGDRAASRDHVNQILKVKPGFAPAHLLEKALNADSGVSSRGQEHENGTMDDR